MSDDEGRRRHYGLFYGLEPLPEDGRPVLAVYGNCQAEALRVVLETSGAVAGVRMPPVHELEPDDLPHLHRLLDRVDLLVVQMIGDDYRGMPLGTAQVCARLGDEAQVARVGNYFFELLYPWQVLVRHEDDEVVDPPLLPYHDVRRLGEAAGWTGPWELPSEGVREVAQGSVAELRRRERKDDLLPVSDLAQQAGAAAGWTVDHPGNEVLLGLGRRVLERFEVGDPAAVSDPGRVLLSSVISPLRPEVLDTLGLEGEARPGWRVGGDDVSDEEVGEAHREFYAAHPRVVEVGVEKKGERLRTLGWSP